MNNTFVSLPVPGGDGAGAPQPTDTLSVTKTISLIGTFGGVIHVQISNDGGISFSTVASLDDVNTKATVRVAAEFMRVVKQGSKLPLGTAEVVVSAETTSMGKFGVFDLPAAGQAGAPLDTSEFGAFNTFIAVGNFSSVYGVEVSDNGTSWVECLTFITRETKSKVFTARWMRLFRKSGGIGATSIAVGSLPDDDSAGTGPTTDELVKVSGNDTTAAFLLPKLEAGSGVSLTVENPGADERIKITADGSTGSDELVKVSGDDNASGFLEDKIVEGIGINLAVLDPGNDEDVEISADVDEIQNNLTFAAPITVRGDTNAPGASTDLPRADHQHRLELDVEDEGVLAGARPAINFIGVGVGAVDNPGQDRVDVTIPGNLTDGAVVKRSQYVDAASSTNSNAYVDGMNGTSVTVPVDGDYLAIFESEACNQAASGIIEIGISVNSLVAVVANSERESQGPASDLRPVITSVQLPGLLTGDLVRCLFRKMAGAGSVEIKRRHLILIKVQ